jgi:hypothetical protein
MTPEIRRAALRAAAKTALVAALGCGGDPKPPPQNVAPPTETPAPAAKVDQSKIDDALAVAQRTLGEAERMLDDAKKRLSELTAKVDAAVAQIAAAKTDSDRKAAEAVMAGLKKDKAELEARIADSKTARDTAAKMMAALPCVKHLATLPTVLADQLPAGDPLRGKVMIAAFTRPADRAAPKTQQCCVETLVAYDAAAPFQSECCSAMTKPWPDAVRTACTPWGPPCPPEMPA